MGLNIVSTMVIPFISAVISFFGIYRNNRIKLAADIVAKSRLDWIQLVEDNMSSLIVSIDELEKLFYKSQIDVEKITSMHDIDHYIDLYHDKEVEVKKAGAQLKLYLLSYPDETETIEKITTQIDKLLGKYCSKMYGSPDLIVIAQNLKEQYKEIEQVESPEMTENDHNELLKNVAPLESYFEENQELLNALIISISQLIRKEWKKAFVGK